MPTATFDMLGTFFSLESLRPRLSALGVPAPTLELWFAESLRDFFALSHAGGYAPIREVLEAALPRTLALVGRGDVAPAHTAQVLEGLKELEPAEGAHEACELLSRAGWKLIALTNGGEASTRALLTRAGLLDRFSAVLSTDSVRTTKPHPTVYAVARERAEGEPWMVAAHAWDLQGAKRAGMRTAWVSRKEQRWLDVFPEPEVRAPDLATVARELLGTARQG
ncbi:HAD hydrolase-like protein [Archangium violaceum]|uniref:HAD family hydrolase n=1 Tax=Archangium violaceum TaxID=83451 RepID=UPI00193C5457|nr:HAD family hydrolase [Archangium violaceum]QRK10217.1 HAD hydrolase-like protein [Archangium violaceum]